MTFTKAIAVLTLGLALAACENTGDKTRDRNFFDGGDGDLAGLTAGIWVDPQGCEHWIVDDGVEGYLDPRRQARVQQRIAAQHRLRALQERISL